MGIRTGITGSRAGAADDLAPFVACLSSPNYYTKQSSIVL